MKSMHRLAILLGFLLLPLFLNAADTIRINITYKHIINENNQTRGSFAINQKFFSPDGELFREINYDETTKQISNYTFYFYKDGKLITEENYSSDDVLRYILKHFYDAVGNEILLTRFENQVGELVEIGRTVMQYNTNRQIILKKEYTGKKPTSSTSYAYNSQGKLIKETAKYKPPYAVTLKSEVKNYQYLPDNKIDKVILTRKSSDNKTNVQTDNYSYDTDGFASEIKTMDAGNNLVYTKIYKYVSHGYISIYKEVDKNNKITLLLEYDYRKHYMDIGSQVSYFDKK